MRLALYHGPLVETIKALNDYPGWRTIFGKAHSRLKDQELILRFIAMYCDRNIYTRPMGEFLNKFAGRNQNAPSKRLETFAQLFRRTIDVFNSTLEVRPFRLTSTLNAAVYDSCMIGMATRLDTVERALDAARVRCLYSKLLQDPEYVEAVSRSTADDAFVKTRMEKAIAFFREA